jgi:Txe/YoeB family toxin of Txe-Axe toxin-antitoxin module
MKQTTREKLIDLILEYAKDEYETLESMEELAKKSEQGLRNTVIGIVKYYQEDNKKLSNKILGKLVKI